MFKAACLQKQSVFELVFLYDQLNQLWGGNPHYLSCCAELLLSELSSVFCIYVRFEFYFYVFIMLLLFLNVFASLLPIRSALLLNSVVDLKTSYLRRRMDECVYLWKAAPSWRKYVSILMTLQVFRDSLVIFPMDGGALGSVVILLAF